MGKKKTPVTDQMMPRENKLEENADHIHASRLQSENGDAPALVRELPQFFDAKKKKQYLEDRYQAAKREGRI